ncbi:hypothetical protein JRI60_05860 [Archangium violaceum]|uniref:hypothetical protein n=1 Tax=Archangium violaceum TaxID=83451 RepID=UPI001950612C|nr:hypothetical protein [Archangium violaceum]QRN98568.1 hypothetical protein JRI60_05860 [Archangium violaceum]
MISKFLHLAFEKYRWFSPVRYGVASLNSRLNPDDIDYDALLRFYEERDTLCVTARTDRDFFLIFPSKPDDPLYTGGVTWVTSVTCASKASWRAAHLEQVTELMRLVRSPFAFSSMDDDIEHKTRRWVPHEKGGQRHVSTVRDYSQGLAGLFWRNFYGPPFIRLFGERLTSLSPEYRQPLGDDLVLVQPYVLPTEAGTEAGAARERELIAHLGPECFYDHTHHVPPTRCPVLDHLTEPLH